MTVSDKKIRTASGFTLVELLVVIVIIAILATITIVAYNGITNRAAAAQYQTEAQSVAQKMTVYNSLKGTYPPNYLVGNDSPSITKQSFAGYYTQLVLNSGGKETEIPTSSGLGVFGLLASDSTPIPTYDQAMHGIKASQANLYTTDWAPGDYFFIEGCAAGGMKVFYPIPTDKSVGTLTLGTC